MTAVKSRTKNQFNKKINSLKKQNEYGDNKIKPNKFSFKFMKIKNEIKQ